MDVFELLKGDHRRVLDIFQKLSKTENRHKRTREDLFSDLKQEMIAHNHAEEKAFYPKLVNQTPTHGLIEEGISEHHKVEDRLKEIEGMPVDTDDWKKAVADLGQMFEHHMREEEGQVFPKAHELLPENQYDPLAEQVKKAEEQEKRTVH